VVPSYNNNPNPLKNNSCVLKQTVGDRKKTKSERNARAEPSFQTISSKRPHADKNAPPTPPPPPSPLHFPPSFYAVAVAVAVASQSEELPPTQMANRWVRPEVSFLNDSTRTHTHSLPLSLMVVPWCRAGVPAVRGDGCCRRHLRVSALPEHHRQPGSQVRICTLDSFCLFDSCKEMFCSCRSRVDLLCFGAFLKLKWSICSSSSVATSHGSSLTCQNQSCIVIHQVKFVFVLFPVGKFILFGGQG